jgi:heme-degrading monooxygenase HmoA
MIARITYFGVHSKDAEECKRIYNEEVLPVIRSQKGNMGAWLLEPTNPQDDHISLTEWISQADADAYESSGTYRTLVDKIRNLLINGPILKTYTAVDTKIVTPA